MPIDRQKKLIFVHIPKNGGTSAAKTLNMHSCWKDENLENLYGIKADSQIVLHSLSLKFYDKYIPETLIKECKIFTVVRNPYDRVLSDFTMKSRGYEHIKDYLLFIVQKLKVTTDFELMKLDRRTLPNHILPQYRYIESDKYNIDFIIRFENYGNEFKKHFPDLELAHTNRSKHVTFKKYFKDKPDCIKLINEIYKKDFEMFGYEKM